MLTVHEVHQPHELGLEGAPLLAIVKGAPDIVLNYCDAIRSNGKVHPLSDADRQKILGANQEMACQALRVLGVAYRPLYELPDPDHLLEIEQELVFVGLLGMIDPARPEVKQAVQIARQAGVKSVMVTGDYRDTAIAIADELGMLSPGGKVLTGAELDRLSDQELEGFG